MCRNAAHTDRPESHNQLFNALRELTDSDEVYSLFARGLVPGAAQLLTADRPPTEQQLTAFPSAQGDSRWGVYYKVLQRDGKLPCVYTGGTTASHELRREGHMVDLRTALKDSGRARDLFNRLASKAKTDRVECFPIWVLDPELIGTERSPVTCAARVLVYYVEAIIHYWLATFQDRARKITGPDGTRSTVWEQRPAADKARQHVWGGYVPQYRGMNSSSPLTQVVRGLPTFSPEERRQRANDLRRTKLQLTPAAERPASRHSWLTKMIDDRPLKNLTASELAQFLHYNDSPYQRGSLAQRDAMRKKEMEKLLTLDAEAAAILVTSIRNREWARAARLKKNPPPPPPTKEELAAHKRKREAEGKVYYKSVHEMTPEEYAKKQARAKRVQDKEKAKRAKRKLN